MSKSRIQCVHRGIDPNNGTLTSTECQHMNSEVASLPSYFNLLKKPWMSLLRSVALKPDGNITIQVKNFRLKNL